MFKKYIYIYIYIHKYFINGTLQNSFLTIHICWVLKLKKDTLLSQLDKWYFIHHWIIIEFYLSNSIWMSVNEPRTFLCYHDNGIFQYSIVRSSCVTYIYYKGCLKNNTSQVITPLLLSWEKSNYIHVESNYLSSWLVSFMVSQPLLGCFMPKS